MTAEQTPLVEAKTRRPPSAILLRLAFAMLVTPAAVVLRIFGIDRLGLRRRPDLATYWSVRDGRPVDPSSQA